MAASSPSLPPSGSIADTVQRLRLWAGRSGGGLALVEYSSEFARQRVVQQLRIALSEQQTPFHEIALPTHKEATAWVSDLLTTLNQFDRGVVSISGFATAFSGEMPLADALRIVNFNREQLASPPVRQIWWVTPVFWQTAIHAMPDLSRWFSPRLHLTEVVFTESIAPFLLTTTESTANIDDARDRSRHLIQQFEQARTAGAEPNELLKTYLLPALEALAEVGAQKELRDLTSQFEGLLTHLKHNLSPELATSLDLLASLYRLQGRYSEAEPLYQQALTLRQQRLGNQHPDVAASLNNLALLYESQGRYEAAEPLLLEALEMRRSLLGNQHPSVATSLSNLAGLYESQGRYEASEPLLLEALEMSRSLLGDQHLSVATSLNNLAGLYQSQGRYEEAEPLYLEVLKIVLSLLGNQHPYVAASLNNLAALYKSQGRYEEAEPLYLEALKMRQLLLGSQHPDLARSLNNLAGLYDSQGRYGEAEPLYLEALKMSQLLLGSQHPSVATNLNNLAELYRSQGRYEEAEPLYLEALAMRRSLLGTQHPDVATSLNNLAGLYYSQRRYEAAELLYLEALPILVEQLGGNHPNTRTIGNNFIDFLKQVVQEGQTAQLSNHPVTQDLLKQIRAASENSK